MRRRRAVITGIGPITCIGTGVENFWNGILAEKSGIDGITSFDPSVFRVRCAGEIHDWNRGRLFFTTSTEAAGSLRSIRSGIRKVRVAKTRVSIIPAKIRRIEWE